MDDQNRHCPGCGKHCELTAPQCATGEAFAKTGVLPLDKGHCKHKHHHHGEFGGEGCGHGHHHEGGHECRRGGAVDGDAQAEPLTMEERLINNLHRLAHALRHGAESRGGQGRILLLLRKSGGLSQHELMELVDVRSGSLSEVLGKLEENGYILRMQNEVDRRRVDIALTDAGMEAAIAEERRIDENRTGLFGSLTEDEQAQLVALLEKLSTDWAAQGRDMHRHHCGHGKHECDEHGHHGHKHKHEHEHHHHHH